MKLVPIISELVNEGLNLVKKKINTEDQIRECYRNWDDVEIERIVEIARYFDAKYFDNLGTGGNCEIISLRLPNGRIVSFANITDNACISSKSYDDPEVWSEDFWGENSDETTCYNSINDISDKSIQTIIQELSQLI